MDKIYKAYALRAVCGLAAVIFTLGGAASAAEFIPLGSLPGERFSSRAMGVSDDGSVVVGQSNGGFVWTRETGMQNINDVIGVEGFLFNVEDVSGDGSTFVGHYQIRHYQISGPMFESGMYRWSQAAGLLTIADVDNDHDIETHHHPASVSTDGSAFVGYVHEAILDRTEAFRYSDAGGFEPLGYLPGGGFPSETESQALDISADGSVVVGFSDSDNGEREAFRWTADEGMVGLGDFPGGEFRSTATAISPDGSVIVGRGNTELQLEGFRWLVESGMESLGQLSDENSANLALDASENGTAIVGRVGANNRAFIWERQHGPRYLKDFLIDEHELSAELEGWQLFGATAVSANGRHIVGIGINPDGNAEGWLVTVPEPASFASGILGLIFVFLRIRRIRK